MATWQVRKITPSEAHSENFQNGTNELTHYGVKGMKWGVRRTPEQLGHRKSETFEEKLDRVLKDNPKDNKVVSTTKTVVKKAAKATLNTIDVHTMDDLKTLYKDPKKVAVVAAFVVLPDPLIWAGVGAYAGIKNSGILDKVLIKGGK